MNASETKQLVQERYAAAALRVQSGATGCCSASTEFPEADAITSNLYSEEESSEVPLAARLASLGCGNPTALAELKPGEVVLDLGSGGGIDVLLSARRVGPTGKAYGLDMTDEMLALARENQAKAGATNVEFLKGDIEHIPLPDSSVDVIISNCVVNLSADKDQVLREAFRVLKPGGRWAISDIVVRGEMPDAIRANSELWSSCVSGALEENDYRAKLAAAGFAGIDLEPTRIYAADDIAPGAVDGLFASMFVRARKPSGVKVQVYDPAMCCSSGVCGPSVDPVLARFSADLDWLGTQGITVERYNLSQAPAAFVAAPAVQAALAADGTACLPMILVDGEVRSQGKYPVRFTLAKWAGLSLHAPVELNVLAPKGCC